VCSIEYTTGPAPQHKATTVEKIDHVQRRGRLTYLLAGDVREVDGWFWLSKNGKTITCRKYRGRRVWTIRRLDVIYFEEIVR
jgi:hypothetical protein